MHTLLTSMKTNDISDENTTKTKQVAFADDVNGCGKLDSVRQYWEGISSNGPKYGYYPQSIKIMAYS